MGTKIIIICGILIVMTILLGWFRLRGLRKCYDKARAEKRDILEREQMALADKLRRTYDKSKVATLKYMVIAPVVIAILGTAVWGINRIVVAQKAEKELVKVEEQSKAKEEKSVSETKYSVKSLFYYFSYDGNLERFVANRKNKLDQAEAEYQAVVQKLDKAKRSGDMVKVTKYSIEYIDVCDDWESAKVDYSNLQDFSFNFTMHRFVYGVLIFLLLFFGLGWFACCSGEVEFEDIAFATCWSILLSFIAVVALIFGFFMSWWSLITAVLVLFHVFVLVLKRKAIAEAIKKAEEQAKNKDDDDW